MSESTTPAQCTDAEFKAATASGLVFEMPGTNAFDAALHRFAEAIRAEQRAASPDLLEALDAIRQYGSDTLSGRADGGPDDRAWQRGAVIEMTRRARLAIEAATGAPA